MLQAFRNAICLVVLAQKGDALKTNILWGIRNQNSISVAGSSHINNYTISTSNVTIRNLEVEHPQAVDAAAAEYNSNEITQHCIFRYQPRFGKRWSENVEAGYKAIEDLQSPVYAALPELESNKRYESKCKWITQIRCDLDDVLTDSYMNVVTDFASSCVSKQVSCVAGIMNINRFTFDTNDQNQSVCEYSQTLTSFSSFSSVGLMVTFPANAPHYNWINQHHDKVQSNVQKMYNNTVVKEFVANSFSFSPITRLSGNFPWNAKPQKVCDLDLSPKFESALRVISKISKTDAKNSLWVNRIFDGDGRIINNNLTE